MIGVNNTHNSIAFISSLENNLESRRFIKYSQFFPWWDEYLKRTIYRIDNIKVDLKEFQNQKSTSFSHDKKNNVFYCFFSGFEIKNNTVSSIPKYHLLTFDVKHNKLSITKLDDDLIKSVIDFNQTTKIGGFNNNTIISGQSNKVNTTTIIYSISENKILFNISNFMATIFVKSENSRFFLIYDISSNKLLTFDIQTNNLTILNLFLTFGNKKINYTMSLYNSEDCSNKPINFYASIKIGKPSITEETIEKSNKLPLVITLSITIPIILIINILFSILIYKHLLNKYKITRID